MVPIGGLAMAAASYVGKRIWESETVQELVNATKEGINKKIDEGVKNAVAVITGDEGYALEKELEKMEKEWCKESDDRVRDDVKESLVEGPNTSKFYSLETDECGKTIVKKSEVVKKSDFKIWESYLKSTLDEFKKDPDYFKENFDEDEIADSLDKYKDLLIVDDEEVEKSDLIIGPTTWINIGDNEPIITSKSGFKEWQDKLKEKFNENEREFLLNSFNGWLESNDWRVVDDEEFDKKKNSEVDLDFIERHRSAAMFGPTPTYWIGDCNVVKKSDYKEWEDFVNKYLVAVGPYADLGKRLLESHKDVKIVADDDEEVEKYILDKGPGYYCEAVDEKGKLKKFTSKSAFEEWKNKLKKYYNKEEADRKINNIRNGGVFTVGMEVLEDEEFEKEKKLFPKQKLQEYKNGKKVE
jgi:hypothetical protein